MAEKTKPKLSPQQLRKLFAMGVLKALGKGDKRKIAYDKPKQTVKQRVEQIKKLGQPSRSEKSKSAIARNLPKRAALIRIRLTKALKRVESDLQELYPRPEAKSKTRRINTLLSRKKSLRKLSDQLGEFRSIEDIRNINQGYLELARRKK